MAIDLLDVIRDDSAIKSGGFTGAIFLTYSLNLTFFEQIIAPALDQAGCSNVLILADLDGYQQALEMGAQSVQDAGLRYVCSPVLRKGQGVQHAKMLFMVGPNRGRLLIGSGNLTFHGFGRNLELYSHFEYDSSDNSKDTSPFLQAWNLIRKISSEGGLSAAALQQIRSIAESVAWLNNSDSNPESIIWHNYERPILEQLNEWRKLHGFVEPVENIKAISPYYDKQLSAIKQLAADLAPARMQIHLDPGLTNLDGRKAAQVWRGKSPKLTTLAIGPREDQDSRRHVHAKAIIGQEKNGSWCISGSANLSYSALLTSWQSGGNLELVTFHWSEDPIAFDYMFDDEMIQVWTLDLTKVVANESEPSEREGFFQTEVFLTDLNLHGERIEGKLARPLPPGIQDVVLHLQRKNIDLPVSFQDGITLRSPLRDSLEEAESARLEGKNFITPYHWIDQPDVLARFGARTYQFRIKGKIETLLGAEKLFQELMNFLWERVETNVDNQKHDPHLYRIRSQKTNRIKEEREDKLPPGPEFFITEEELVHQIQAGLDHHYPYDRSLLNLRDLLSLVLLRIATPTQSTDVPDQETRDEDQEQKEQAEREKFQNNVLERIRAYLLSYCNRYGSRLIDAEFIRKSSPEVIFQNHYTLGRVLLEFSNKASAVFTRDDLHRCFWIIWGPLVWPNIVGLDGTPTLRTFINKFRQDRVQAAWAETGIPNLVKIMFGEVLGQPPSWRAGLWDKEKTELFIVASEWIKRIKQTIGDAAFSNSSTDLADAIGIPTISGLYLPRTINSAYLEHVLLNFSKIENYLSPVEEKYEPLLALIQLEKGDPNSVVKRQHIIEEVLTQGLNKEYEACKDGLIPILGASETDDGIYCPKCNAKQTNAAQNSIGRGELTLCTYMKDAWIFLRASMPKQII